MSENRNNVINTKYKQTKLARFKSLYERKNLLLKRIMFFVQTIFDFKLLKLKMKITKICLQEQKKWSNSYHKKTTLARKLNINSYYQGFDKIKIVSFGTYSCEKRVEILGVNKFANKKSRVLDIGSNMGFLVLSFAPNIKEGVCLEINPYLNDIGKEVGKYLNIDNVSFVTAKFEEFEDENKFDVIISSAAFYTADGHERSGIQFYFDKINKLLAADGYLLFETTSGYHSGSLVSRHSNQIIDEACSHIRNNYIVYAESLVRQPSPDCWRRAIWASKKK